MLRARMMSRISPTGCSHGCPDSLRTFTALVDIKSPRRRRVPTGLAKDEEGAVCRGKTARPDLVRVLREHDHVLPVVLQAGVGT